MQAIAEKICAFIAKKAAEAGARGVVVGVSGGLDSAVAVALCSRALGKEKVHALILPEKETVTDAILIDAREVAGMFAGTVREIDFSEAYAALAKAMPGFAAGARVPNGNLKARIRMCFLYYHANAFGLLVAGTGDKSEISLGYFTKYGDGGCDMLPIGDLYKTEVRKLGRFLGVPERIVGKESSPGLWAGHTAKGELGMEYEKIDEILKAFADGKKISGVEAAKILKMVRNSEHKRRMPEVCGLGRQA